MTGRDPTDPLSDHEDESAPSRLVGEIKLELVQPEPIQRQRHRSVREQLKDLSFWVNVATLIVVGWYAHSAAQQVQPMINAANAARDAADAAKTANQITISSNRPVITMSAATMKTNGTMNMVYLPYKNSGKWTARYLGFTIHALIGDLSPVGIPVIRNSSGEKCDPSPLDTTPLGEQDGYQLETQIMNGFSAPATAVQVQDVRDGKTGLWAIGCIGYRDDFGNAYVAPICQYYRASDGTFVFCQISQSPTNK